MTRARIYSQSGVGVSGNVTTSNVTLATLSPFLTTANVIELTNLYFTNARVFANLQLASIDALRDVNTANSSNGQALIWNSASNVWAPGNVATSLTLSTLSPFLTTANVTESNSNLYYTNARVLSALTGNLVVGNLVTGTSVSNSYVTAGNVNAGNIITGGIVRATGNGTFGNVSATGYTGATVSVSGNANVGNLGATGVFSTTLSATGNATVGNVLLNGGLQSNRTNVSATTNTIIDQFVPATYRTAKYIISASSANGFQSVEALLVHNGTDSFVTIYGSICSNVTADIIDISSNINGVSGNVAVYATSSGGTATVNLITTYLKT
jgi:hypothetical protein